MTIKELKNVLQNYNEDAELHVSCEGELFQIEPNCFREATLFETKEELVDSSVYTFQVDGPILKTFEVVIIDLDDE